MGLEEIEQIGGRYKITFVDENVYPVLSVILTREDMIHIADYVKNNNLEKK